MVVRHNIGGKSVGRTSSLPVEGERGDSNNRDHPPRRRNRNYNNLDDISGVHASADAPHPTQQGISSSYASHSRSVTGSVGVPEDDEIDLAHRQMLVLQRQIQHLKGQAADVPPQAQA